MNLTKSSLLCILFVFTASISLFSQDKTWDGGGAAGVWEDPLNWNPNGVPTNLPSENDVLISGAYSVTVSSTSTIESIALALGADLTIAATYTLTVANNGNHDGIELDDVGTTLTVNGTLNSNDHGNNGIDINENGSFTVSASGIVSINNVEGDGIELSDNMTNAGVITITIPLGKAGIQGKGGLAGRTISNSGSITISGGVLGIDLLDPFLLSNTGTVTVSNASSALVDDGSNFTNNGTFKGNGLIQNGTNYDFSTQPGSTLAPGTSVGKLTFAEQVDFSGINLNIEINGLTNYDQVVVNLGSVKLGGATLNLSGGYVPVIGETFMILEKVSAGPINGTFSGVPNNFTISYTLGDGNDVVLTFIGGPLPIELIDFSAQAMENEVKLAWTTANETNNDYFTLERSLDGRTFEAIAMVSGNGNTTEISKYVHMDKNPRSGLSYYRLKQTDFDGKFSYSDLETVDFGTDNTIKVYPTFVENDLTVETGGDLNSDLTIIIRDLTGREHRAFVIPSKSNNASFSLDGLIPGSYFVIIFNNETIQTQKIIKL